MATFGGKSPPKDLKIGGVQFGLPPVQAFAFLGSPTAHFGWG
jgi:hypothetical protein